VFWAGSETACSSLRHALFQSELYLGICDRLSAFNRAIRLISSLSCFSVITTQPKLRWQKIYPDVHCWLRCLGLGACGRPRHYCQQQQCITQVVTTAFNVTCLSSIRRRLPVQGRSVSVVLNSLNSGGTASGYLCLKAMAGINSWEQPFSHRLPCWQQ